MGSNATLVRQGRAPVPDRRLLTLPEAASYCGLSVSVFGRVCPVVPISLSGDGKLDRRLLRYDVTALDEWINTLSGRALGSPEATNWAARVFE